MKRAVRFGISGVHFPKISSWIWQSGYQSSTDLAPSCLVNYSRPVWLLGLDLLSKPAELCRGARRGPTGIALPKPGELPVALLWGSVTTHSAAKTPV